MIIKREKGLIDIPIYMSKKTEKVEYTYTISYRGFHGHIIRQGRSDQSWWIVSNAKWIVQGERTKKGAELSFKGFVDEHYDLLVEKDYIKTDKIKA